MQRATQYRGDTIAVAKEFRLITPPIYLLGWTLATALAVVIAAGVDISAVY